MRQNFLDFISERNQNIENKKLLNEAFKDKDIEKALDLIESVLKKHIDGLVPLVGFVETVIDGNECTTKQYIVIDKNDFKNVKLFQFNWLNSEGSSEVYSIDFFKSLDLYWYGEDKSDLTIYTLGTSIARFLPIIWNVINKNNYSLTPEDAKKISSQVFKGVTESKYHVGKLKYTILEGLSNNIIKDCFVYEANKEKDLESDIEKINQELSGDSKQDADIKLSIERRKSVKVKDSESIKDGEKKLEDTRKDPEQIFKEMAKYISLVIKGLQPSLILCGAPDVGKTYRVKKQLKSNGYVEGDNLCTIKGKCTARKLYLALYGFKDKGDIVLIDDADSLVGPNADENCINILKAALDSTTEPEGRLVTYGVAGKILDDEGEEVPKKCYCKNGVIVITNYRAGALDTALRGRSFIQDIDFTNEEVLSIIDKLLPKIEPGILDMKSKIKSYKYLCELNKQGSKMELSLRTFVLCAKIFRACEEDSDFTDEDAKSMIEEQMRLQYARASKTAKY